MRRLWLVLVLLFVLPGIAYSATYYVSKTGNNSNTCNTASAGAGCTGGSCAKLTVQAGVGCLVGGDILLINNGTYIGDTINNPAQGSSANHTIIRSMNGKANVTMQCSGTSIDQIVFLSGQQFIEIDGITFDANSGCGFGIAPNPATDNFTLKNSQVKNARHSGVLTEHGQFWLFDNVEVNNNGTDPTLDHGLYWSVRNSEVRNSYIHHNACYGTQNYSAEGAPPLPVNNKWYNNTFEENGCGVTSPQGSGHEWVNNVFDNENTSAGANASYFIMGFTGGIVYNNTFYCTTTFEVFSNTSTNVRGNIFYCPGVTLTRQADSFTATFSNNLYNTDPSFVSNGADFNLQSGSVAIDASVTLTQASPDKNGITRPQGSAYDYGCCERVSSSPVATSLHIVQGPTNAFEGIAISPAVTVEVLDQFGARLTSSTATIVAAIGTNPGSGTLGGTTSVAAISGLATFNTLNINNDGVGYTLVFTSSGLTGATSSTFNIVEPSVPSSILLVKGVTGAILSRP